jgi:hypothetical protein
MDSAKLHKGKDKVMPKKKTNKTIETLYRKMEELDMADSYGIVFLKGGMAVKLKHHYQFFLNGWVNYKTAKSGTKEAFAKLLKETGGLLTNGDLTVEAEAVMAAISVYQIENESAEPSGSADDFLNLLDPSED